MPWRASHRRSAAAPRGSIGFTLIELLVVLAIIGVVLAVVPAAFAGLPSYRLRAATAQLAADMRAARDQAVRTGATVTLTIDPEHRSYDWGNGGRAKILPDVVDKLSVRLDGPVRQTQVAAIEFFGDGTATAGRVVLDHGRRHTQITLDWLTGRVHIDD